MRKLLIVTILILPVLVAAGQGSREAKTPKVHKKEIAPEKLPKSITAYIQKNLPSAKITKAVKQRKKPDAAYIVYVTIKTKHHTLVFNKSEALVKLDGKRLKATVAKE